MNLYVRYFDNEALVYDVEEALDFLRGIRDITMTKELEADVRRYAAGDDRSTKRCRVKMRNYFIMIKTTAATLEDFKQKKGLTPLDTVGGERHAAAAAMAALADEKEGWYEGTLDFKRVVMVPATGKFEYRDTRFVAACKAASGQECYGRIVAHLRQRVDGRSQFPSARGKNFAFRYLGGCK